MSTLECQRIGKEINNKKVWDVYLTLKNRLNYLLTCILVLIGQLLGLNTLNIIIIIITALAIIMGRWEFKHSPDHFMRHFLKHFWRHSQSLFLCSILYFRVLMMLRQDSVAANFASENGFHCSRNFQTMSRQLFW